MRAAILCAASVALLGPIHFAAVPPAARPPGQAPVQRAGLDLVMARAKAYAIKYLGALSSVVCEERYDQRVTTPRVTDFSAAAQTVTGVTGARVNEPNVQTRSLVSDFLLVQVPGVPGWLSFRDVYSVDGRKIRDREDRLVKLFIEPHPDRLAQAERIRSESSRYNIGAAVRDINVPTLALEFLLPDAVGHFAFQDAGEEPVDGDPARVVSYIETARPSFIRNNRDEDVPASGQFWINPEDGGILRTRLETKSDVKITRIEVDFRPEPRLGLRVPVRMDEVHEIVAVRQAEKVTGLARYSNFRQFRVDTTERIR